MKQLAVSRIALLVVVLVALCVSALPAAAAGGPPKEYSDTWTYTYEGVQYTHTVTYRQVQTDSGKSGVNQYHYVGTGTYEAINTATGEVLYEGSYTGTSHSVYRNGIFQNSHSEGKSEDTYQGSTHTYRYESSCNTTRCHGNSWSDGVKYSWDYAQAQ